VDFSIINLSPQLPSKLPHASQLTIAERRPIHFIQACINFKKGLMQKEIHKCICNYLVTLGRHPVYITRPQQTQ